MTRFGSTEVPEWFTTAELAAWLQVPPETVYKWRYTGSGPRGVRLGRHVRYRRTDVEAWLTERRQRQPR